MILIILGRVGNQPPPYKLNFPYHLEKPEISSLVIQADHSPLQSLFFVQHVKAELPNCLVKNREHETTLDTKHERRVLYLDD